MNWTTPEDIRKQLDRYWTDGRILTARLRNESLFPLALTLKKPGTLDLSQRFEEVRAWIKELESGSKEKTGFGYVIEWSVRNHRELGRNTVPDRIVVPTEADALQLLEKVEPAESFHRVASMSLEAFPALHAWLNRRPAAALEHAHDWSRILEVLAWFRSNPRSGLYQRQIEIPGVDTKFIEERRRLISELLEVVLGTESSIDRTSKAKTFEQRYGLRAKAPLVRFRLLDKDLYIHGLSDLAVPAVDFARLAPGAETVFITENEINGLTFPDAPGSLVIFGLGYGLDRLSEAVWLNSRRLFYWGDIDTHGFAMLDRFRAIFPGTTSFLMDRETLIAHRGSWGRESERCVGPLHRLKLPEKLLFQELQEDTLGPHVRLEQELIGFRCLRDALQTELK